jgi:hypothetical protein
LKDVFWVDFHVLQMGGREATLMIQMLEGGEVIVIYV